MGIYDRDYVFNKHRGPSGPGMLSITVWLIIANIACFLLQTVTQPPGGGTDVLSKYGHFSTVDVIWHTWCDIETTSGEPVSGVLRWEGEEINEANQRVKVLYINPPGPVIPMLRGVVEQGQSASLEPKSFSRYCVRVEEGNVAKIRKRAGGLQFWRFVSFQFLHAGLMHIAFNMFGLYMFGPMVESRLGRQKYLAFYLTCGLFGGFAYFVLNALGELFGNLPFVLINDPDTSLVGASAGVFGVIVACARISPDTTVQLIIPPVPVKLKFLAYAYIGIAVFTVITGGRNAGGEAAHLGGAAAGFFFIKHSHLLRDFWDVLKDSRRPSRKKEPPPTRLKIVRDDESELDALLDRVNAVGHANLTQREKDRLADLTRKRREADGKR
ncbi:MAG: rhomboid family intramembrane serine protease [Phycisphaerales bacterium]